MTQMLLRLFRPRLALANGVAAAGGYLLSPSPVDGWSLTALIVGVTTLAAAGSAFNQVQERDLDARMVRTRLRPLPQGKLAPTTVILIAASAALIGLLLLGKCGEVPALLALTALVWYLAVYTPLKRRTALAVPIGAVCGVFPPLIGWNGAGGSLGDYRIILLAGLFYLWQVPHFWLLQRRHAQDYKNAGLPLLDDLVLRQPCATPLLPWLLALMAAALLLPALGVLGPLLAPWFVLALSPLLFGMLLRRERVLQVYLNFFPLLITLSCLLQRPSYFYYK